MNKKTDNKSDIELTDDELKNLAGFFDVLIQMDLEQKHKATIEQEEEKKPESHEADLDF